MHKIQIFIYSLIFLLIPIALSSGYDYQFKVNTNINIQTPCFINNSACSAATQCNMSIIKPDGIVLLADQAMTRSVSNIYTLSISNDTLKMSGVYSIYMTCMDQGYYGFGAYSMDLTGSVLDLGNNNPFNYSLNDQYWKYGLMITFIILSLILAYFGYKFREYLFLIVAGFLLLILAPMTYAMNSYFAIIFGLLGFGLMVLSIKFMKM
jgi:hypothetical protein